MKINNATNLDALFVIHPANHLNAHFRDLIKIRLIHADISEDLDHPLPDADTRILRE
jgi:hypothetical protein